ncbi:cupin-like domain-containing protein [Dactylosporangium sp. CA-139066]|uniref:cupin-like domain-containing protein n=1 Tax=Dactylosporangium sp. CA-139066 TaxID=3239930 RepID=UPI003D8E9711
MTFTDTIALDATWRAWMAENLALGAAAEEVRATAAAAGIDSAAVEEELSAVLAHPYFRACRTLALRSDWAAALMDLYAELRDHDGGRRLDRRTGIDPQEFFGRYYFGHRPVVLCGLMEDWPARAWTLDSLAERFGDEEVEVMTGREANPDHAWQYDRHRTRMPFRQYLDLLRTGRRTNDYYMVPRNDNTRGALRGLASDVRAPAGIVDPNGPADMTNLLLGPAGTVTPLHVDAASVLLGQVLGRKHVRLVPSFQRHLVYPRGGTFSAVDAAHPDLGRHPLFARATVLETVLQPGEMLFIPAGWWHWVEALDVSASMSFHQFAVDGGNHHVVTPPAAHAAASAGA